MVLILKESFPVVLLFKFLMDEAAVQTGEREEAGRPLDSPKDSHRGTEEKSQIKPNPRVFYTLFPKRITNIKHMRKVIE